MDVCRTERTWRAADSDISLAAQAGFARGRGVRSGLLLPRLAVLKGAWMPSMAEDVAIVTHAACARLAGVERCGLLRDRVAIRESYQNKAAAVTGGNGDGA